jgi:hypothetical protein
MGGFTNNPTLARHAVLSRMSKARNAYWKLLGYPNLARAQAVRLDLQRVSKQNKQNAPLQSTSLTAQSGIQGHEASPIREQLAMMLRTKGR